MKNDFYVYEWYNKDNNEVFYVGKGRINRYKEVNRRNKYFKNYYNKYNCDVRKVKDNMTENEAFQLEISLIGKYREINQCQCNLTNGGEGCTFSPGSWNEIFRRLQYMYMWGHFDIMENEEDYSPESLKNKTIEEMQEMYEEYIETKIGIDTFNSLNIYDEYGNLNPGWECFED